MSNIIDTAAVQARLASITADISAALAPYGMIAGDLDAAKEARKLAGDNFKEARTNDGNVRENVMGTLASLAATGMWTPAEIKLCAARVTKNANHATTKSAEKFHSEMVHAMQPNVAPEFARLVGLRDEVFASEHADLAKRAFHGRAYHALIEFLKAANDKPAQVESVDSVIAWANERDPNKNAEKTVAKVETIMEQLQEMLANFPGCKGLDGAIKWLACVDANNLRDEVEPAATVAEPEAEPENEPEPDDVLTEFKPREVIHASVQHNVAEGVFDPAQDMMLAAD